MPIPRTTNVRTIIEFLSKENPSMPLKQRIAIAYSIKRDILKKRRIKHGRKGRSNR